MTKGEFIKAKIIEGLSDGEILNAAFEHIMPTTINSIRWYRSKMKKGEVKRAVRGQAASRRTSVPKFMTVSDALERFGLADEAREACSRLTDLSKWRAEELYDMVAAWNFVTNSNTTSRYGQCRYRSKTLEVHVKLLDLPEDLRLTLFHEIAHALDWMIHGRSSGHGSQWQYIMRVGFKLAGMRCGGHTEEASDAIKAIRATKAIETWVCNSCGTEVHIIRKRKYSADRYKHPKCGGNFRVKEDGKNLIY